MKAILLLFLFTANVICAETVSVATKAINALGIDILQKSDKPQDNFLISPYSIQSAMAMAHAGAEGATRDEMAMVLHFPKDDAEVNSSFAELRKMLDDAVARTIAHSKLPKEDGGDMDPITLTVANRLFGQEGYSFRPEFLTLMKDTYDAPFNPINFKENASEATKEINAWVEKQTQNRLRDLIPERALDELTRLVLVNAIYLKAPWADPFSAKATKPQLFRVNGAKKQNVPMMSAKRKFGYAKHSAFQAVAVPYVYELQFLILLPNAIDGLAKLEEMLTPELLDECSHLDRREVILQLPKFKLPAQTMPLAQILKGLGMKTAFHPMEANFGGIAPRTPNDNLSISGIFHMTFLSLDEKGTEAAAATSLQLMTMGMAEKPPKPIEVKVDHPFLFAIQHRSSGACLFLGRVTNPR